MKIHVHTLCVVSTCIYVPHVMPGESRTCCPSMTCCFCLRARQSQKSAILRTPLQPTPAVSPVKLPEVHYQVPTVATAQVINAHGSDNSEYAYTDITNNPPWPNTSGPLCAELLHPPLRTHGNSNLSYTDLPQLT